MGILRAIVGGVIGGLVGGPAGAAAGAGVGAASGNKPKYRTIKDTSRKYKDSKGNEYMVTKDGKKYRWVNSPIACGSMNDSGWKEV